MDYIIIGTDHTLQKSDSPDTGLRDLLRSIIDAHDVVLIAEEVTTSEDVHTFGRELIGESKWLSIDMTKQQQINAGIYEVRRTSQPERDPITGDDILVNPYHKKAEAVRENFWLDRIAQWCEQRHIPAGTVVLTCGDNHVTFVAEKLKGRGHTVTQKQYLPFDKEVRFGRFWIYDD